jgi:hypothetical protein
VTYENTGDFFDSFGSGCHYSTVPGNDIIIIVDKDGIYKAEFPDTGLKL